MARNQGGIYALAEVTVVELECQVGGCVAIIVDGIHIGASAQARLHNCQPINDIRADKDGRFAVVATAHGGTFMQRMLPFMALCMSNV